MTQAIQTAELTEQWQQHIKAWQTSGMSQAAYCKQHDLIYHRFGYWYRKLIGCQRQPSGFARVVQHHRRGTQGLSVRLPNGIELHGVEADNLSVVKELLRQLS